MLRDFDNFLEKFKFITKMESDSQIASELEIKVTSFRTMKNNDKIPYSRVIKYCKDRCIDLNWILDIQNKA